MFKNEPNSPLNDFLSDREMSEEFSDPNGDKFNPRFEKEFFNHYIRCKKLFLLYKNKSQLINRLIAQTQYQVAAQDVLIRNGIQNYEKIAGLKNKVKMSMQDSEKDFSQIVDKFNSAIKTVRIFPFFF
jgi:hypothetical protein